MSKLISFQPSKRADKKYQITLANENGRNKTIHFGSKGSQTYLDHKDKTKRQNYIARHKYGENWNEINAGSLSKHILWGKTTSLDKNLNEYLKKFNIKK